MLGRFSLIAIGVLGLLAGIAFERLNSPTGTRVVFLSVGQGDSTLFMSDDWVVLVDAGPLTEGFDSGERLIAPQLRALGVRKIDCLVITHPDLDHVGGLETLAERFRIGRVVVSSAFRNDKEMLAALGRARFREGQVSWISGVWKMRTGDMGFVVAAPSSYVGMEANEGSLFVRADFAGASLLITGDANSETEAAMSGVWDWDVDVLKAGHHGSRFSTSDEWLGVTSPSVVIASCGRRNMYGHPAPAVVERVREFGAEFLRTDQNGTIVMEPIDGDWTVKRH